MSLAHSDRQIILKRLEDRRIRSGHPWVFSNEIAETRGNPSAGDVVELVSSSGDSLGVGFFNPHSLIAFRLLSSVFEEIDRGFFERRIESAIALRRVLYGDDDAYRVIHGEGDFLPGLVVDRFNEYLVVQTFSFGMDARLPLICDVLEGLLAPLGIMERNESPLRDLEGLPQRVGAVRGTMGSTTIHEHGLEYRVDPSEGQKTGYFFDQRESRLALRRYCPGAKVLDCFCNLGGFSLNAARAGAQSVLGIDSSSDTINRAQQNASLNGMALVSFTTGDVFEELLALAQAERAFDVIVLDPPSFTRSRKNVPTAKKGYRELHRRALPLLRKGGILFTASCSHHIEPQVFLEIVDTTARKAGRNLQMLEWRGASPDHPTLPAVPETRYLKSGFFRVM